MSTTFKKYLPVWCILFVLLNITAWVVPLERSSVFYTVYFCLNIAFLVNLWIVYFVSQESKYVYAPIIKNFFVWLIILFIINIASLLLQFMPWFKTWMAIIANVVIIALHLIEVVLLKQNANRTEQRDVNVSKKVQNMKLLTAKAKALYDSSNDKTVGKLYEALRYADAVSNDSTIALENDIEKELDLLGEIKDAGELENKASEIIKLINKRNTIAKQTK